jgi:hypothetical protein
MTTVQDVSWGKYQNWEGPFVRGAVPFTMPNPADENAYYLAVVTATEGGHADGINMYDRCIVSTGFLQFCEASYYMSSNLLGAILDKQPGLLDILQPALDASGAEFKKNPDKNRWRFFFTDSRGEVDTAEEQKQLFLLNSDGTVGSWDDDSIAHAKLWASCLATLLSDPDAVRAQIPFVAQRIKSFALPNAQRTLLSDALPSAGWVGALRAAYLSFAVNLPAVASKQLDIALANAPGQKWSPEWCTEIIQQLTFGPKIALYPHRYDAIRPVLERLYGTDLPDFSAQLAKWQNDMDAHAAPGYEEPTFQTPQELQRVLISLGYDLGPAGADGKIGQKTLDVIRTFQRLSGLTDDGQVGPLTRAALLAAWRQANNHS